MTMPTKLSSAQAERYLRDGFVSPITALTREQAAYYRGKLEAFEKSVGGPLTVVCPPFDEKATCSCAMSS